jgi:hypothetical protein
MNLEKTVDQYERGKLTSAMSRAMQIIGEDNI